MWVPRSHTAVFQRQKVSHKHHEEEEQQQKKEEQHRQCHYHQLELEDPLVQVLLSQGKGREGGEEGETEWDHGSLAGREDSLPVPRIRNIQTSDWFNSKTCQMMWSRSLQFLEIKKRERKD
jgi:hypothetical protein